MHRAAVCLLAQPSRRRAYGIDRTLITAATNSASVASQTGYNQGRCIGGPLERGGPTPQERTAPALGRCCCALTALGQRAVENLGERDARRCFDNGRHDGVATFEL